MTKPCLLCALDDAAVTVAATPLVTAVVSLAPINGWHVPVVPRHHYERFADLPAETMLAVSLMAQRVSRAIQAAARPDGVTYITEDDFTGQGYNMVAHWKLHVIGRFKDDGVKLEWGRTADPGPLRRATIAEAIRDALSPLQ